MQYQTDFKMVINNSTPILVRATFPDEKPPNIIKQIYGMAFAQKYLGFAHQVSSKGTSASDNRYFITKQAKNSKIIGLRMEFNGKANPKLNPEKNNFEGPENKNLQSLPGSLRKVIFTALKSERYKDLAVYNIGNQDFYALAMQTDDGIWTQELYDQNGNATTKDQIWDALPLAEPDFS